MDNKNELSPPNQLESWTINNFCEFTIFSHPDLSIETYRNDAQNLVLLGNVIDPLTQCRNTSTILKTLSKNLSRGCESFFDYLDNLTGRFVLFVESSLDNSFAVQDAAGTRSLFYDTQTPGCLLASHPEIIAMMAGYEKSKFAEEVIQSGVSYFPGLSTPYTPIRRLTPNTLLTVPDGRVKRFFPRKPLTNESPDKVVPDIADILTNQMKLWNENNDLLLSLSAGMDSRLSLAATKEIAGDVEYYSWIFPGRNYGEADVAAELCNHLGLDHQTFDLLDEAPDDFVDVFMKNNSYMSDPDRAHGIYNFLDKLPDGRVELRSNVAEVGRAFYRNYIMKPPERIDPRNFTKLYYRVNSNDVLEKFDQFFKLADFNSENMYNYDPYDLYYWEHRMGSWFSTWMTDKDLSHDNFIVYNNRELLKNMLSVDMKYRKGDYVFLKTIEELWPECLDLPINPHKDQSKISKNIKRAGHGITIRTPLPIYQRAINKYQNI